MQINMFNQKVPQELIDNLPEGLKIVSRKGNIFIVIESVKCPGGHSLASGRVNFHGEPAIHILVKGGGAVGNMYLDPFWGLHLRLFDFMFTGGSRTPIIDAFCPVCNSSLMVQRHCDVPGCGADKFLELGLPQGNKIHVCAKWECPQHDIMIDTLSPDVTKVIKSINFPDLHSNGQLMGF